MPRRTASLASGVPSGVLSGVPVRQAVPGLLGSAHLTVAALGAGHLPLGSDVGGLPIIDALRSSVPGSFVVAAAALMGVALLLQSWLVLGHDVLSGAYTGGPGGLRVVLLAWSAPLLLVPPLFSRDLYSYFVQGRLIAEGHDPYVTGVGVLDGWFADGSDPTWALTPSPYGPTYLLIEQGVHALIGEHPFIAALTFRALSFAGLVALSWCVPALARRCGVSAAAATWLACLNPVVVMDVSSAGHNDALMAALVVAAFLVAYRHGAVVSALAGSAIVGLAASVKPVALAAVPFVALVRVGLTSAVGTRIRLWLVGSASSVAVLVAASYASGFGLGWIGTLGAPTQTNTPLSATSMLGLAMQWLLSPLGVGDSAVSVVRGMGVLAAAMVLGWLLLARQERSAVKAAGIGIGTLVVLSPAVHSWYLLWFLPLLAAAGISRPRLRLTIIGVAVLALAGVVGQNATADTRLDIAQILAVALAAAIVGAALLGSRRERMLVLGEQTAAGLH